jgi:hypothetical protein
MACNVAAVRRIGRARGHFDTLGGPRQGGLSALRQISDHPGLEIGISSKNDDHQIIKSLNQNFGIKQAYRKLFATSQYTRTQLQYVFSFPTTRRARSQSAACGGHLIMIKIFPNFQSLGPFFSILGEFSDVLVFKTAFPTIPQLNYFRKRLRRKSCGPRTSFSD